MKQNCLSNTPFLPLLLVKVNASQSYTQYFIQEIHEIKTAEVCFIKKSQSQDFLRRTLIFSLMMHFSGKGFENQTFALLTLDCQSQINILISGLPSKLNY